MRSPGRIEPPGPDGDPGPDGAPSAGGAGMAVGAQPRRRPDVVWEELDGEVVIYDPARTTSHLLNPSAAVIWALLDGNATLAEVAADLAETFGVEPTAMLDDVSSTVAALEGQGLLADWHTATGEVAPLSSASRPVRAPSAPR